MYEKKAIKVLVVDHLSIIGSGIAKVLQGYEDMDVVGHASLPEEVIKIVEQCSPDFVTMDINFPDPLTGLKLIRQLHLEYPQIRVIILSNTRDAQVIHEALKEGVLGYLFKNATPDELAQAIRSASVGNPTLCQEAIHLLVRGVTASPGASLTNREQQVLALIAQGMNNQEIARELSISMSTTQFHISNILQKLNVQNRIEAAAFALRHGLTSSLSTFSEVEG